MTRAFVRLRNAVSRALEDRPDLLVWIVVGIALIVRLAWVAFARRPAQVGDPASYVWYGDELSHGRGYNSFPAAIDETLGTTSFGRIPPTAFYAIGYPLFLALLFAPARAVGMNGTLENYAIVYGVVHALVGAATVYLVARIARRVWDDRAAIVAAIIVALWPNLIMLTATAHLETLYLFLLAAAVLVLLPLVERDGPNDSNDRVGSMNTRRMLAGGALLGIAAEVRPLVAFIVPGVLLAFRYKPTTWRAAVRSTAIVTFTMLAFVAPWTIRNAIQMPGFVLVTTGSGDAFCMSRYEGATGRFEPNSPGCLNDVAGVPWDVKEVTKNRENTKRAITWAIHHPKSELRIAFWRGYYAFRDDHEATIALENTDLGQPVDRLWDDRGYELAATLADLWYLAAVALALIGIPTLVRRGRGPAVLILGTIAAAVVVPFMLFGDPRYKVPMHPFVAVIAAVGVERLLRGPPSNRSAPRSRQVPDPAEA
jgi:hypothetical protein